MTSLSVMAEHWYGYGRWDAPYWFLGPEPGGDDALGPAAAFDKLHCADLLDCKEHHFGFGYTRWHTPPYKLQKTWRRLMLLVHVFKSGEIPTKDELRMYQAFSWGAKSGETCVIELSSLAARSLRSHQPLRLQHVEARIQNIRNKISQFRPLFVVMYSTDKNIYVPAWKRIAPFDSLDMCRTDDTVAMITPHPLAHDRPYTDSDWVDFAIRLRQRCKAEGLI